jgi:hypothetical protein
MALASIVQLGHLLNRNLGPRRQCTSVQVERLEFIYGGQASPVTGVHLRVWPTVLWAPSAGQFVYISIPAIHGFARWYPFYVAWWGKADNRADGEGDDRPADEVDRSIVLVAEDDRFTRPEAQKRHTAIIDGPYGDEHDLRDYDTIVLLATGTGVAGQICYLKQAVEAFGPNAKEKKVVLLWLVECEGSCQT